MSAQPLEIRMAHLEGAYEQINERLRGIDGRLFALESKMDSLFHKQDAHFDAFDKKLTTLIVASLGSYAALTAAVIGAIVASHHL